MLTSDSLSVVLWGDRSDERVVRVKFQNIDLCVVVDDAGGLLFAADSNKIVTCKYGNERNMPWTLFEHYFKVWNLFVEKWCKWQHCLQIAYSVLWVAHLTHNFVGGFDGKEFSATEYGYEWTLFDFINKWIDNVCLAEFDSFVVEFQLRWGHLSLLMVVVRK